jgi:hypothetical protein
VQNEAKTGTLGSLKDLRHPVFVREFPLASGRSCQARAALADQKCAFHANLQVGSIPARLLRKYTVVRREAVVERIEDALVASGASADLGDWDRFLSSSTAIATSRTSLIALNRGCSAGSRAHQRHGCGRTDAIVRQPTYRVRPNALINR